MNRIEGAAITALCAIIALQGWMLWRAENPHSADDDTANIPKIVASTGHSAESSAAMSESLALIDARLAAIEREMIVKRAPQAAPLSSQSIDPQAMAAAERRLASIIPDGEFDHDDMRKLDSALARLSKEEKIQLMTAFSRAVNTDRIKLRM